jgi:hypothetical protein
VAIVGAGGGVVLATRHHAAKPPPPRATASPRLGYYPVPASIAVSGAGATLTWGPQAGSLPGFAGYLVSDVSSGNRPLSPVLPRTAGSFAVHGLRPGKKSCFLVIAVVTAPPSGPVAQPACVTPPKR